MRVEYIPVATSSTVYHEPQTEQEFDELVQTAKVGDMIFSKWVFQSSGGLWYTVGLMDKDDPTSIMLFPNITFHGLGTAAPVGMMNHSQPLVFLFEFFQSRYICYEFNRHFKQPPNYYLIQLYTLGCVLSIDKPSKHAR